MRLIFWVPHLQGVFPPFSHCSNGGTTDLHDFSRSNFAPAKVPHSASHYDGCQGSLAWQDPRAGGINGWWNGGFYKWHEIITCGYNPTYGDITANNNWLGAHFVLLMVQKSGEPPGTENDRIYQTLGGFSKITWLPDVVCQPTYSKHYFVDNLAFYWLHPPNMGLRLEGTCWPNFYESSCPRSIFQPATRWLISDVLDLLVRWIWGPSNRLAKLREDRNIPKRLLSSHKHVNSWSTSPWDRSFRWFIYPYENWFSIYGKNI